MPAVIKLEDIHKTYHTGEVDVHAVCGVSLEIAKGEFVAIMGASGSGKSTMMNILGCLDRPTSGRYFLDGVDVSNLSREQLADIRNQKIGFVFQGFNLLSRTSALENVELPMLYSRDHLAAHELRERAMQSLQIVSLADRATMDRRWLPCGSSAAPGSAAPPPSICCRGSCATRRRPNS